jgi:uncharacterized membrane protein
VQLAPGQSKRVAMTLPRPAYSYWSVPAHNWDAAPGAYAVSVGSSSRDLPLHAEFRIQHADGAQGIAVQAPGSVDSGSSIDVTVSVTNTGGETLTNPDFNLRAPSGWSVTATSRPPVLVPAHGQAALTYRVRAPERAGPALYVLTAKAGWKGVAAGTATRAFSLSAH